MVSLRISGVRFLDALWVAPGGSKERAIRINTKPPRANGREFRRKKFTRLPNHYESYYGAHLPPVLQSGRWATLFDVLRGENDAHVRFVGKFDI